MRREPARPRFVRCVGLRVRGAREMYGDPHDGGAARPHVDEAETIREMTFSALLPVLHAVIPRVFRRELAVLDQAY